MLVDCLKKRVQPQSLPAFPAVISTGTQTRSTASLSFFCSALQSKPFLHDEAYTSLRRTETMARSPVLNRHSKISAPSSTTKLVFRLNNIDLSMVYTFSMLLLMVRHTMIDNSQVLDFEATRFSAAPCLISMTNTCPALVIDSLSLRYMTRASPPTDWGDIRKRPTSYFIICGLRSS